ncbi:MAG: histidinol-phosphate transaminase [Oscillospiraceae bacterium]|nr:histidinol-phosphate transaminase [Oscillospiraceae bacterium]MDD4413569.1 histidinol-phosphate transaminase [Oscillospiraceae bacterium]
MSYKLSPKAQSLKPYDPIEGFYRIRLDANESFLLPTEEDREAMINTAASVALNRYPDPLAADLCFGFARAYGISSDYVTAGNGSDELISIIMSAFLQKGEKVLTLSPDFSMYRFYTSITENPCVTLDKNEDMTVDIDMIINTAAEQNIRLIIFSNPCNPTSLGISAKEMRRLISSTNALIVLDEAYMDFWDQSLIKEAQEYDNLILLRTCSKALGMAGLRIGFAIANSKLTSVLRSAKSPYNVNSISQAMARIVLKNRLYQTEYIETILNSRNYIIEGLRKLEEDKLITHVYDSCTNFAFIKLNDAQGVFRHLVENGIIVRCFGDDFLRITAGTQVENTEMLRAIEDCLKRRKET